MKPNKLATTEIEKLQAFKNRLIYSVSHEIKTPLNTSITLLDLALESEDVPEVVKAEILKPSIYNNYLLLSTINDILDFSSIELGTFKFNFEPFDVEVAIRECLELVEFQTRAKNLSLELKLKHD